MNKKLLLNGLIILLILFSSIGVYASATPIVSVENVSVAVGQEIKVPIRLSNNTGICGATISVSYDSELVFKNVEKGDALSTLNFTGPGNISNNPFNIVYDGITEDKTNGIIAYLYFNAVSDAGIYDISISYVDGDIMNDKLAPIDVEMIPGQVTVTAGATDNDYEDNKDEEFNGPIITVGKVTATPDKSIIVPIYLSQNTGICGATLVLSYNEKLTLTKITKGDSFTDFTLTPPGNLTANPCNLVFDAIEESKANGLLATLTFKAPSNNGIYDININYIDGDIMDGKQLPVDVLIKNGHIAVGIQSIEVVLGDKIINLSPGNTNGNIYIAAYTQEDLLISLKRYPINNKEVIVQIDNGTNYIEAFCWANELIPLCESQKLYIK